MTTHVNAAGDLSWYTVTSNENGHDVHVQARLWIEARTNGEVDLTQRFGAQAISEGVEVVEMPSGWVPPVNETRTGSLAGDRCGGRP